MIKIVNECYDCPIPCIDCGRKHMEVRICDDCQQVSSDYIVDGEDLCEDCLVSRMVLDLQNMIREIKDGYDIMDTAELLGYNIRRV